MSGGSERGDRCCCYQSIERQPIPDLEDPAWFLAKGQEILRGWYEGLVLKENLS